MCMYLTWLDNNSWLIEFGGQRILLDPWLVGQLVFAEMPWLFKGVRPHDYPIPEGIDLLLLSQGLPDHSHPPTLKQLDHNLPVVGSPAAAGVVQKLGYSQVTALEHGQTYRLADRLEIKAVPGSLVGPTTVENGYLIKELDTGLQLYYEPHGFHSQPVFESGSIDVVITPMTRLSLPLVGPIIKGGEDTIELAKRIKPQVMLPTATTGEAHYEGVLVNLLNAEGGPETIRQALAQADLSTQVITPAPQQRTEISLRLRSTAQAA